MNGNAALPFPHCDNRFVVEPAKRIAPSIMSKTSQGFVEYDPVKSCPILGHVPVAEGKCCPAPDVVPPTRGVPNSAANRYSFVSDEGVLRPIVSSINSQKLFVMSALPSFPPVPYRKPNLESTSSERQASNQSMAVSPQPFLIAAIM